MRLEFDDVVNLAPGADNYVVNNFNMPQPPTRAGAWILKGGSGADNITVTPDYSSFSITGGTFHFSGSIPSDGNTYKLYFFFKI